MQGYLNMMIDTIQILSYIGALGIAAAIPGPGMTALVARSISGGTLLGFAMLAGLILGDLIYLSIAVFGLSIVASTNLLMFINYGSAFYLSFLAWQFWRYQPEVIEIEKKLTKQAMTSAWFSGLTITLGNPKTIAFYLAILPFVISLENVSLAIWIGVLVPLTIVVLLVVGTFFIYAAMKIRRFLISTRAQKILFRTTGLMMLSAAIWMVVKTL